MDTFLTLATQFFASIEPAAHAMAHAGAGALVSAVFMIARRRWEEGFVLLLVLACFKEIGDPTFSILDVMLAAVGWLVVQYSVGKLATEASAEGYTKGIVHGYQAALQPDVPREAAPSVSVPSAETPSERTPL